MTVRCLQLGGKLTGAIGFESLEDPEQTIGPLAALNEPARTWQSRRHFAPPKPLPSATQAEVYRSAILDALAHEFKTPLATIPAAAGGLREAGSPEFGTVGNGRYCGNRRLTGFGCLTSRLLCVARLDREEVRPRIEMTDIGALVDHSARQQYSRQMAGAQNFSGQPR